MARIRTIKPEFPQSESIGKLSRDARLLYIQLWTIVDDAGRARAASRMLASLLYPYDDDAREQIEGWLLELEQGEHIHRYEVEGSQYLEIVKWLEHQKIDKPSKSRLPEFAEGSRTVAKSREASVTDLVPSTVDLVPSTPPAKPQARANENFEKFKAVYPRRAGNYGWKAAERKFLALVKTGVDPGAIIAAAGRHAEDMRKLNRAGTEFVPMPASWLNSEDFVECAVVAFEPVSDGLIEVLDQRALDAWSDYERENGLKQSPRNKRGGWRFPTKWPPGYTPTATESLVPVFVPKLKTV